MEYDIEITLEPATDYKRLKYGLITPKGELFACGYTDHDYLTEQLCYIGKLDENDDRDYKGSVHITSWRANNIEEKWQDAMRITQKQLDTLFDYYTAHGKAFSTEGLEIIDARKTRKAKISPFRANVQSLAV